MSYYDGHPNAGGLEAPSLTGRFPEFAVASLRVGMIIDLKYSDEEENRTRSQVEYEVRDINTAEVYKSVRRLQDMAGITDGDDDVLHPASKNHDPNNPRTFKKTSRARDTDGDLVVLGFINGVRSQGVILGVLRHAQANYGAKKADGERRMSTHKGTTVETKADGTYVITRATKDANNQDKTVYVQISPDGVIHLNSGRGAVVRVEEEEVFIESTVKHVHVDAEKDVNIGANGDVTISALKAADMHGTETSQLSAGQVTTLEAPQVKLGAGALPESGVMNGYYFKLNVSDPLFVAAQALHAAAFAAQSALIADPTGATSILGLSVALQIFADAMKVAMTFVPSATSTKVKVE